LSLCLMVLTIACSSETFAIERITPANLAVAPIGRLPAANIALLQIVLFSSKERLAGTSPAKHIDQLWLLMD
jgi:hypothetical protein